MCQFAAAIVGRLQSAVCTWLEFQFVETLVDQSFDGYPRGYLRRERHEPDVHESDTSISLHLQAICKD